MFIKNKFTYLSLGLIKSHYSLNENYVPIVLKMLSQKSNLNI